MPKPGNLFNFSLSIGSFTVLSLCRMTKNIGTKIAPIPNKISEIEKASFYGNDEPKFGQFYITLVDIDTKHAVLLTNCPIPADLKIPKKGWKKLPIATYQKEVDAYFEEALNSGINQLFPKCE